ncbi:probable insulin-like peptide 7 [Portunus trituberculatus]|uniref:probable insulin-like peptide 7 n=1 Tax=Portunus trituberculatus TaxID=210409 RepID=UPI001E1D1F44|nr:probable insulin-like peptide 7 [Portunus trituberculatus]
MGLEAARRERQPSKKHQREKVLLLLVMFIIVVVVMVVVGVNSTPSLDPDLLSEIENRNARDWEALWTEEHLALCRLRLRHNLDSICGKDVFRRSAPPHPPAPPPDLPPYDGDGKRKNVEEEEEEEARRRGGRRGPPLLSVHQANLFVTTWIRGGDGRHPRHPRHAPSITSECCTEMGCTWEEYAEYCPSSSRLRPGVKLI